MTALKNHQISEGIRERMEPDSTTSVVSAEPADERKEVSMDSSSKCLFCEKDLSKDEYLTHLKVSNTIYIYCFSLK